MKNLINNIAHRFGYSFGKMETFLEVIEENKKLSSQILEENKNARKFENKANTLQIKLDKTEGTLKQFTECNITPKKDVLALFDILKKHSYSKIFEANFQNSRIYAYATITKMLWFEINTEGEIMTVLKQINENDKSVLIEKLTVENASLTASKTYLKMAIANLQTDIKAYTVKNELENTQEFYELTPKEKALIDTLETILSEVKKADVKLRDIEV